MSRSLLYRASEPAEPPPKCVLVAGAAGGIGSAFCRQIELSHPSAQIHRLARDPSALEALNVRTFDAQFDITCEPSIRNAIIRLPKEQSIDWVFMATGWLHDERHKPEKTFKSLNAEHLQHAYLINAIGPVLMLKQLINEANLSDRCRIGILSARVGSISDNRLGGWHAYRASKAALNMLIKNFAIELARKTPSRIVVGLQPGTTDTALSAPYQRNVISEQLQTPEYTAHQLLQVMQNLQPEDSGGLFDFLGLPFAP